MINELKLEQARAKEEKKERELQNENDKKNEMMYTQEIEKEQIDKTHVFFERLLMAFDQINFYNLLNWNIYTTPKPKTW